MAEKSRRDNNGRRMNGRRGGRSSAPAVSVTLPDKIWTTEQLALMTWLAMPEHEREPATHRKLAKKLKVRADTLSHWKRLPGFGVAVVEIARAYVKVDKLADILHAMTRAALAGNVQAARFLFEVTGETEPQPLVDNADRRVQVLIVSGDGKIVEALRNATESGTVIDLFGDV